MEDVITIMSAIQLNSQDINIDIQDIQAGATLHAQMEQYGALHLARLGATHPLHQEAILLQEVLHPQEVIVHHGALVLQEVIPLQGAAAHQEDN